MLNIKEVSTKEQFDEITANLPTNSDILFICKFNNSLMFSDNGVLGPLNNIPKLTDEEINEAIQDCLNKLNATE